MTTGAVKGVGLPLNKQGKPKHYLEKRYPIEGRKDFFKWVIVTPKGLAKDFEGKEMYFDPFQFELAKTVLKSIRKTARINNQFLN